MTYVERLLQAQAILAGQLEPEIPELKEIFIPAESFAEDAAGAEVSLRSADSIPSEEGSPSNGNAGSSAEAAEVSLRQAEEALQRLQSSHLRAERMAAGQEIRQISDRVSAAAQSLTAEGREGGSFTQPGVELRASGIAGMDTQRSMSEISRFFERDSRRYGG